MTPGKFLTSLSILLAALFLLGVHSALFGPVKYAILPQHLAPVELLGGNALVEAGTFVAILIGTIAGSLLAGNVSAPVWIAGVGLAVAGLGYLASRRIPAAPAPAPELRINFNPLAETWRNIALARQQRTVFIAILGISWFWLYGSLLLTQFPLYTKVVLGGGPSAITLLLAIFTCGIGLGSMLCERLSGRQLEIGLVPLGAIGLSLFGIDLYFASPATAGDTAPVALMQLLGQAGFWRVLGDVLLIGLFGGFFIVPLYTLVQVRSAARQRARIIATTNILNALFMVIGALAAAALLGAGLSIPALFALTALTNAAVTGYLCVREPEFGRRFIAWLRRRPV